jgi:YidC/Oxa1 family membrane protein insertase
MKNGVRRLTTLYAVSVWDPLLPLNRAWWAALGVPMVAVLHWLVGSLGSFPITLAIGPFGLGVIAMTVMVRFLLLPLSAYQVRATLRARREAADLQARLAPQIAALERRYRRRPLEYRVALAELLRQNGAGSLATLASALRSSALPLLVQTPVLIAFYWVIQTLAHSPVDLHFLWVANLAAPDALLLPLLAGVSTYVLSRVAAASAPPSPGEDEQAAAARRTTMLVYPLVLVVSAHFAPAALVLYWVTTNLVGAGQQWVLTRLFLRPRPSPAT